MYAVYDANDFRKADRIQLLILFIGFTIAAYIWLFMGIDVTNEDEANLFVNHVLPIIINHGITTNVGYFVWRMIGLFNLGTIIISSIIGAICTVVGIILITNIRPKEYIF